MPQMGYARRCPFCEKVIAASTDQLEEYRAFMVLHLMKCGDAPATMTYAAAVELTASMFDDRGSPAPL